MPGLKAKEISHSLLVISRRRRVHSACPDWQLFAHRFLLSTLDFCHCGVSDGNRRDYTWLVVFQNPPEFALMLQMGVGVWEEACRSHSTLSVAWLGRLAHIVRPNHRRHRFADQWSSDAARCNSQSAGSQRMDSSPERRGRRLETSSRSDPPEGGSPRLETHHQRMSFDLH